MNRTRRPFWLPASNYYVLAVGISTAFFFLVWGVLHDGGEEMPWVTAGISASILLCGAVVLREVILRKARRLLLEEQHRAGHAYASPPRFADRRHSSKLSLERNAAILAEIRKKSDAAKVLHQFSAGHREVFELCREYIARSESELTTVNAGSPRLPALLKGRSKAADYHRYHLLRWAEIESRTLTEQARGLAAVNDRIEAAQGAVNVIDTALESYPAEPSLLQSRALLVDLVVSIKVSDWVEKAERAVFEGEFATARAMYRDALFYLGRDNVRSPAREQAARHIAAEIEKLREKESSE